MEPSEESFTSAHGEVDSTVPGAPIGGVSRAEHERVLRLLAESKLETAQAQNEALRAQLTLYRQQQRVSEGRGRTSGFQPDPLTPARDAIDYDDRAAPNAAPGMADIAAGRRLSNLHAQAPLPAQGPNNHQPNVQFTRPAKLFPGRLELNKDSTPPTLERVTEVVNEMATFVAKEQGAEMPQLALVMSDKLRDLIVSNNVDLMDAITVFTTSNDVLLRCLMKLCAPRSEEQAYILLRDTYKRFGMDGAKVDVYTLTGVLPNWLNFLRHFASTYDSIVKYADPAYHPAMKSHAADPNEKRLNSFFPVLLEPLRKVAPLLAQEMETELNRANPKVTSATQAISIVEKSVKDDVALLQQPAMQRLLRTLKPRPAGQPVAPPRQPQQETRLPFRNELQARQPRLNALQHHDLGRDRVRDDQETEHDEDAADQEESHLDSDLHEEELDEQADYGEGNYGEAEVASEVSPLKYQALSFHAISAVQAKATSEMPCFSKFRTGECRNSACQYGHSTELMRARWRQEFDALKRNPFSDLAVPGGRAAGGGGGQFGRITQQPGRTAAPTGPRHKTM